jgi:hypothetical protein
MYIGDTTYIAHRSDHIPLDYDGRFYTRDVIGPGSYVNMMLSNKFSYNITYDKQKNLEYPDGNVYISTKPSKLTKVSLDPNSSSSAKLGIFDKRKHKTIIDNVKYWETNEDGTFFMIRVSMATSQYYGNYIDIEDKKLSTVLACQDQSFDGIIEYKTKGFQFFLDGDFFISGIKKVKGNPYIKIDGKDYINMNMLVSELGATSIVENGDILSFKMKSKYSNEPACFEIRANFTLISTSSKKTSISITSKNVDANFFMTPNDLKKIFDVNIKTYPYSKSLCISFKQ